MAAVEGDRFDVAYFLIGKGADVRMHDGRGGTPLYVLADKSINRVEYGALASALIKAGANVNAKTGIYIDGPSDETILHRAVGWGHTELVKMLIQNGANVNARTSSGKTPIDYLYKGRNDEVIRAILVQAGAK
jgi:cytohesin